MRQQLPPQIKKTDDKRKPYVVRVDAGTDPATGNRRQLRRKFRTEREARDFLSETQSKVSAGQFVARQKLTVKDACANYVAARHNLRETSRAKLEYDLSAFVDHLGDTEIQKLTKTDIDRMVSSLVKGGSKTANGRKRKPWGPDTTNKTIDAARRVLADAQAQGLTARNVAEHVDHVRREYKQPDAYTESEVQQLFSLIDRECIEPTGPNHGGGKQRRTTKPNPKDHGDRLAHAWHLGLSGLRRGEIAGLRWSDVDFDKGTLSIENNRVMVGARAAEGDTKTITSRRVLPMPPRVVRALKAAQIRQSAEADVIESVAGTRNARGYVRKTVYRDSGYVVVNEIGEPYAPVVLSRLWAEMLARYGLRHVKLHASRSTCATLMVAEGVPVTVVAAWLGQRDSSVTLRRYAVAHPEHLTSAASVADWVTF